MQSPGLITGVRLEPDSSDPAVLRVRKAFWKTRQIAAHQNDRDVYIRRTIQEMFTYGVFAALFIVCCSDLYSRDTYVVNREISSLFLDLGFASSSENDEMVDVSFIKFNEIITMENFWKYFYHVLCEKLYELPVGAAGENQGNGTEILYENKFLYRPRSRQVRVQEGHCKIRNQFKGLFQECYVPYEIKYEDKASFGPKKGTQWTYSDDSVTQGVFYEGEIAYYGAGGYYFDFPKDKSEARKFIKDLEYNTWLNRGTRAVFVDFAIYNCNINVVCVAKLVFEFPASGGIVPSSSFRTVKLYRYAVADSLLDLFMMLAVVAFLVYFTVEELNEMAYFRLDYFTVFWNIIDFSIVVLGWCSFGVALAIHFREPPSKLQEKVVTDKAASRGTMRFFEYLVTRHEILLQVTAYAFFLVCVKIIKYTDLNRTMTIVYLSVGRSFKIVAGYLVLMTVVVIAFAMLGYCAFGAQVKGFSTVNDSFLSSLRILMRDFDFRSLEQADQSFTAFIFVLFTCVVIFVILTMLVAIVFHGYFDVNVEELLGDRKRYVCDSVSTYLEKALERIGLRKWVERRQEKKFNDQLQGQMTYEDVYKTLKRCGFTNFEVQNILDQYGIQRQKTVHEDEAKQMFRDVLRNKPSTSSNRINKDNQTTNPDISSDIEWRVMKISYCQT
ncbi:Polycystic kidney disease type 2 protein,Polycystin cation channel, PKD1/PKD2 [Cinara cedri]|uniref:Polycystic kidney disease type 2 protein,Polycystin cation channel, PKD1/PKD2 n=1 Tax=Cinara cedri TaxID=506608 RepID=A0A5E4MYP5_9HEMI|nr:Polycystic kidney disease type 2 protein,Polycystin cation channel, PKD1/PKD2 [Cinara cedri]